MLDAKYVTGPKVDASLCNYTCWTASPCMCSSMEHGRYFLAKPQQLGINCVRNARNAEVRPHNCGVGCRLLNVDKEHKLDSTAWTWLKMVQQLNLIWLKTFLFPISQHVGNKGTRFGAVAVFWINNVRIVQ